MRFVFKSIFLLTCLLPLTTIAASDGHPQDFLIANVLIVDGTGDRIFNGAVKVMAGVITQVGELVPAEGETVIDGKGQVLAPGFIDTHSHADSEIQEQRDAFAAVSQGIKSPPEILPIPNATPSGMTNRFILKKL